MRGGVLEFWNEKPADDFLDQKPDFSGSRKSKEAVWSTITESTECILFDGIV